MAARMAVPGARGARALRPLAQRSDRLRKELNRASLLRWMPYRPTERTEAKRAQARERFVEAAHALIARGGYRAASVSAVAARAGVATGSVYRHFPSKAELFA